MLNVHVLYSVENTFWCVFYLLVFLLIHIFSQLTYRCNINYILGFTINLHSATCIYTLFSIDS